MRALQRVATRHVLLLVVLAAQVARAQNHCTSWCHWDWPTHCAPGTYRDCAGCKECKELVASGRYTPKPSHPPLPAPPQLPPPSPNEPPANPPTPQSPRGPPHSPPP